MEVAGLPRGSWEALRKSQCNLVGTGKPEGVRRTTSWIAGSPEEVAGPDRPDVGKATRRVSVAPSGVVVHLTSQLMAPSGDHRFLACCSLLACALTGLLACLLARALARSLACLLSCMHACLRLRWAQNGRWTHEMRGPPNGREWRAQTHSILTQLLHFCIPAKLAQA